MLGIEWTEWRRDIARTVVAGAIARHGARIAGVWCDSGLQGVGSLEAFLAAGRRPGEIPPWTPPRSWMHVSEFARLWPSAIALGSGRGPAARSAESPRASKPMLAV